MFVNCKTTEMRLVQVRCKQLLCINCQKNGVTEIPPEHAVFTIACSWMNTQELSLIASTDRI